MRSLIPVDDNKLRRHAFSAARRLLRQLEQLEFHVAQFERVDQKQYADWYDVMFQQERRALDTAAERLHKLRHKYQQAVFLAESEGLSDSEALRRVEEEIALAQRGSLAERERIEAQWAAREQEYFRRREKDEEAEAAKARKRQEREHKRRAREEAERQQQVQQIRDLDDAALDAACTSPSRATEWLWLTLWDARVTGNADIFLRVWDASHGKIQNSFRKAFEKHYDVDFGVILDRMRGLHEVQSEDQPEDSPAESAPAPAFEDIKLLYRQLVRRLHPDASGGEMTAWQKDLWLRAQDGYRKRDYQALERVLRLIQLRGGDLNSLRLSEIRSSQTWLQDELNRLRLSIKGSKTSPAWGFSRRKDFGPVHRRAMKAFEKERLDIDMQIEGLELRLRLMRDLY